MLRKPNILWFSLEDTSPRFGCYGDPVARTPNLDRIAAEGCIYPNAFCVAGVCAPSRSAIITGMYPTFIGSHHMRTTHGGSQGAELPTPYHATPPAYVKCFTEYLRAAGYYCSNNDKTDYQFESPFTAWDDCSATAHWRNRKPGQPFFAVFNPTITHESGQWPPGRSPRVTDPAQVRVPPFLCDNIETRNAIARQYDNIHASDQKLGQILRELEEDGLLKDTIIFIWSDHGEGLPRAKRWPYDSGIRIPLIVRWPGTIPPGGHNDQLVSLIDLPSTMLSLCGMQIPMHMQGQAFLGPQEKPARKYVFATRDRYDEAYDMMRAVRDKRFKYVRNYHPELPYQLWIPYSYKHESMHEIWKAQLAGTLGPQRLMETHRPPEELYDLSADPFEMTNVAGDPRFAGDLARLRGVCDQWRRDYDRWGDTPESEMVRQWYPDGRQPQTVSPYFVAINAEHNGQKLSRGGVYKGPMFVQLYCPTQGASIGYTIETGDKPAWRLYTGPIRLEPGARVNLRAKATRIGYKESRESGAAFMVE